MYILFGNPEKLYGETAKTTKIKNQFSIIITPKMDTPF